MELSVSLYRDNPEQDKFPYMKNYKVKKPEKDIMVLDLLNMLKEDDATISYRRSCREGVCGSDGMNINGKNGLACITPLSEVLKGNKLELRPLPGLPVIRDLIVDMTQFYEQYEKIKPFLLEFNKNLDTLKKFSDWMTDKTKTEKDDVSAAANDYLKTLGYVSIAYAWIKVLEVSFKDYEENKNFYNDKIDTARFYFDKVLPRAEHHYKSAISGSSNIMNFKFN